VKLAKAIAARIKELREAAGLSQQEVAMRADLSMSLVAKIEQGKKGDPRASTLLALSEALGVPPGRLLENLLPPKTAPSADSAKLPEAVATAEAADDDGVAASSKPPKKKKRKKGKAKTKGKAKVK